MARAEMCTCVLRLALLAPFLVHNRFYPEALKLEMCLSAVRKSSRTAGSFMMSNP